MHGVDRRWWFGLFFISGFSGLLYQIVWLRLAFAAFGIVSPVMSVLLSVFMLGLGVGSWFAGWLVGRFQFSNRQALRAYAVAEALIGLGGVVVPRLFLSGEAALLPAGDTDSVTYLACSAGIIVLSLLPFCVCMGLTYPLMMQAIRSEHQATESFSFLYLANVIGAMCGAAFTPVVLVELLGFRHTLWVGACGNWCVAALSFWLSKQLSAGKATDQASAPEASQVVSAPAAHVLVQELPSNLGQRSPFRLWVLFTTGLASMAIEVVWTRAFTPVLKTQVYSFAGLLFMYLFATWCGSWQYRQDLARQKPFSTRALLCGLSLAAFGQLLLADPRIQWPRYWLQSGWVLLTIAPYCGILGYLTPKLIDEYSAGNPRSAGRAYAVNILGCIVGPLLGSYLLLATVGVQWSGILLALPLWGLAGIALRSAASHPTALRASLPAQSPLVIWGSAAVCALLAATVGTSYENQYAASGAVIRRDHTATVIAYVEKGQKELLVNGTPITSETPTTKLMAHLPLCYLQEPPRSALVICFGMGTTYRSMLSWDIETTAVELVPSVRDSFGYFFADAEAVRHNPLGTIVVDDGRRYLRRTTRQFDVITIDPPPPVEAAGSSLLYSKEFYEVLMPRLSESGILQQWFPGGDLMTLVAVVRSISEVFPHLRVMRAYNGWGVHILASRQPLLDRSPEELAARLPEKARIDLLEWSAGKKPTDLFGPIVGAKVDTDTMLKDGPKIRITDNDPYNEYFILRRLWEFCTGTYNFVY